MADKRQTTRPTTRPTTRATTRPDSRQAEARGSAVQPSRRPGVYGEAEVRERLKGLPGWSYEGGWIRRQYKTDGWPTTLMLVGAIGYVAEAAYHHPDLEVSWGKVVVRIRSHEAGGVTDKCLALARKIEEIALWRPAPGDALTGTPNKFVRGE